MRFIEIPALITEDIEDPSIVDITEPITVSISGTTMTIDGGSKVSGEATVNLTGDTTINAFTLQNIKHPSLHKISVKTNNKGNFTYVPTDTVTASSVSTTTKTGSDFEILLITTNGGETYADFDMADYTSPALYTSNALTGFDISELTSTYGATAKLYKPDGTLLTTVNSATTGGGVNFGYTESIPGEVTYTLEVEDDLGRKSKYDLPRKWISYAMETNSTPGFEKLALAGNEYTSTTIVPNISTSSKVRVHKKNNHGYLGINFKIQGRNTTNGSWVDIDDTGENENDDESKEYLAFGDYLYHRVWVKPTAKATATVSSSNVVTLSLTDFTEENLEKSFENFDPYDIDETSNTYVFEETSKVGTIPFTLAIGDQTYSNAFTVTTIDLSIPVEPNTDFTASGPNMLHLVGTSSQPSNYMAEASGDGKYIAFGIDGSGNFKIMKGDPETGYTDYATATFSGASQVFGSMSYDGKYIIVASWGTATDYEIFKHDESTGTYTKLPTTYPRVSTNDPYTHKPAFVPRSGNYDFALTGTDNNATCYIKLYKHNAGTDTWTEQTRIQDPTGRPNGDRYRGQFSKSFTRDGKYLMFGTYSTYGGYEMYTIDWDANTAVFSGANWVQNNNIGHSGAVTPDGKYALLFHNDSNSRKIFKNNDAVDWSSATDVTSEFTFNNGDDDQGGGICFFGEHGQYYISRMGGSNVRIYKWLDVTQKSVSLTYNDKDRITITKTGGLTTTTDKLYKDGVLYETLNSESMIFISETGVYQVISDDKYYSNKITVTTISETESILRIGHRTCFLLRKDGKVMYWGESFNGSNGMGNNTETVNPTLHENLNAIPGGIKHIGGNTGDSHAKCAISGNGKLYTWGYNGHGSLGRNNTSNYENQGPWLVDTQSSNTFTRCFSGYYTNFALQDNGYLWGCGYNGVYELADGSTTNRYQFVRLNIENVMDFCITHHLGIAVTTNNTVYMWGNNNNGAMGGLGTRTTPTQLTTLDGKNIVKVRCSHQTGYAISSDGKLYAWGYGGYSLLPYGSTGNIGTPTEMTWFSRKNIKLVDLECGWNDNTVCLALDDKGNMYVWGQDGTGALGDEVDAPSNTHWPFLLKTNIETISVGHTECGCIDKFGQVYTWGNGTRGAQNWIHGTVSDTHIYHPTSNNLSTGTTLIYDGYDTLKLGKKSSVTSTMLYGSNTLSLDTKSDIFITDPHTYTFKVSDASSGTLTYLSNVASTVSRPTGRVYPPKSGTRKSLGSRSASANHKHTWTVDGAVYGNGGYTAYSSGSLNSANQSLFECFDGLINQTCFHSANGQHLMSVILEMPQKIKLTKYAIYSRNYTGEYTYAPRDWKVYGSNDGSNWTELDSRTNETVSSWGTQTDHRDTKREYTVSGNTKYFSQYKYKVNVTNGSTYTVLSQIEYYGDEDDGFITYDGFGKVTVDTKGDTGATSNITYYSNTYEMGTARDLYITDTGDYTVDIYGSTKAFLGTHTVSADTIDNVPGFTLAFHHGTFADSGDPYSDGSVTTAATNGHVFSDTATGTYTWGTLDSVTLTASTGGITDYVVGKTEYTYTPAFSFTGKLLMVAGGGGGGGTIAGGGGAGGLLYNETASFTSSQKTIIVGDGGIGGGNIDQGTNNAGKRGHDTSVSGFTTAIGGGAGGGYSANDADTPSYGGSGGGYKTTYTDYSATTGQGNQGGEITGYAGGGGGGAGEVGADSGNAYSGAGGDGLNYSSVFGTTYGESGWFSGGGGGGGRNDNNAGNAGPSSGGLGGGGNGDHNGNTTISLSSAMNGQLHTGGGGGGGGWNGSKPSGSIGGKGGSGIVLIKKLGLINPPTLTFDGYNKLTIENVSFSANEWPPTDGTVTTGSLGQTSTWTISGASYGNGTYIATSSVGIHAWNTYTAFDKNLNGDSWHTSNGNTTGTLKIQFPVSMVLGSYSLYHRTTGDTNMGPKDWTIEGSNDGSTWITIDTQTTQDMSSYGSSANGYIRTYTVSGNTTKYSYYRIVVTANNGQGNYLSIGEWKIFEPLPDNTSTIKKDGAAFATTTSDTVYIRDTGTYTAEVKGLGAYAIELSTDVTGSISSPTLAQASLTLTNASKNLPTLTNTYALSGSSNEYTWRLGHANVNNNVYVCYATHPSNNNGGSGSSVYIRNVHTNETYTLSGTYTIYARGPYSFFAHLNGNEFIIMFLTGSTDDGIIVKRMTLSSTNSWTESSSTTHSIPDSSIYEDWHYQCKPQIRQRNGFTEIIKSYLYNTNQHNLSYRTYRFDFVLIKYTHSTSSFSIENVTAKTGIYFNNEATNARDVNSLFMVPDSNQYVMMYGYTNSGSKNDDANAYGRLAKFTYDYGDGTVSNYLEVGTTGSGRNAPGNRKYRSLIPLYDSSGNINEVLLWNSAHTQNVTQKVTLSNLSHSTVSYDGNLNVYSTGTNTYDHMINVDNIGNYYFISYFTDDQKIGLAILDSKATQPTYEYYETSYTYGGSTDARKYSGHNSFIVLNSDGGSVDWYILMHWPERSYAIERYNIPLVQNIGVQYDNYNKITLNQLNYEDTAEVTYYSNTYNLGTAKTVYVKDTGEYVFKISGIDKYVESNVYVSSVDLAGAPTKPIDFDGYNKLTLIDAGSNVSANVTYFSNTYELGSANVLYINGAGTYDLEMSGSNVFALSNTVVNALSTPVVSGTHRFPLDSGTLTDLNDNSVSFDSGATFEAGTLRNDGKTSYKLTVGQNKNVTLPSALSNWCVSMWVFIPYVTSYGGSSNSSNIPSDFSSHTSGGYSWSYIWTWHMANGREFRHRTVHDSHIYEYSSASATSSESVNMYHSWGSSIGSSSKQNWHPGNSSNNIFMPEAWHHMAWEYNGTTGKFKWYCDGIERTTAEVTMSTGCSLNGMTFGDSTPNGSISDDTSIWWYISDLVIAPSWNIDTYNLTKGTYKHFLPIPQTLGVRQLRGEGNEESLSSPSLTFDTYNKLTLENFTTTYKEWPPASFTSPSVSDGNPASINGITSTNSAKDAEWVILGADYGNGTYKASTTVAVHETHAVHGPFQMFNKVNGGHDTKTTTTNTSGEWTIELPSSIVLYKYSLHHGNNQSTSANYPKDWTIEGSNDGTTWVVLDTRSNETYASSVTGHDESKREYSIVNNTTKYKHYKLNVSAINSGSYILIGAWKLFEKNPRTAKLTDPNGDTYSLGQTQNDIYIEDTGDYVLEVTNSEQSAIVETNVGTISNPTYPFNPLAYSFPITLNGEPAYIISSESKDNYIVELQTGGPLTSVDFDSDGNLITGSSYTRNPIVPDYANSPFKFNGTQDYSVYLKWKYDFVSAHDRPYFYIGETEISTYPRNGLAQTGQREVRWAPSTSNYSNYTEVGSYTDNQFVHLVLTYDASSGTYKLYYKLNDSASIGVSTKTETVVTSNAGKTFYIKIGNDMGGSSGRGTQYTKDIAIFNSVLTQTEAESYINNGISISPNPPSLTFDTYNKLSIENLTPTSTTLTDPNGSSFDIGTASNVYIEDAGTYKMATGDATTFALVSKQVNTLAPKPDYTNIWAGEIAGMVIDSDGKLYTWGSDNSNESGRGASDRTPTHISTISDPVSNVWVDGAPGRTRIVKTSTNKWYMWGMNGSHSKIFGQTVNQTTPVDVTSYFTTYFGAQGASDSTRIVKVVMSANACSALAADGKVWSWGKDESRNELGNNTNTTTATPFKNTTDGTAELTDIVDICSLHYGKLALDSNGDVWQWGQLRTGSTGYATKQTDLDSVTIIGIGTGFFTAYAWDATGTIYSTGQGTEGQLGNGADSDQDSTWQTITTLQGKTIYGIYGAGYSVFAHTSDGVYACGQGANGRLGMGNSDNLNVFTKSVALSALSIYKLDFGHGPGYIITTDGKGYALGRDAINSIPTPLSGDKNVPTEASSLTNLSLVPPPPPSLTYDTSNKLSIENLTPTSTTLTDPNGTSFDIGTATDVYIRDSGKYSIVSKDANTFLLASNTVTGTPTGTYDKRVPLAFHHGTFADSGDPHGDGSITTAAVNGHVYSDTPTGTYSWGTLGSCVKTEMADNLHSTEEWAYRHNNGNTPTAGYTTYTWTPTSAITNARTLVVAGGGGGGTDMGGGGGAGGLLASTSTNIAYAEQTIQVGDGGARGYGPDGGSTNQHRGGNGANSSISGPGITAIGGGGGATGHNDTYDRAAGSGGSGGGGSGGLAENGGYGAPNGTGTPGQGYDGGNSGNAWYPGGGGGAGEKGYGRNGSGGGGNTVKGNGGNGIEDDILGTSYWWAGGGGCNVYNNTHTPDNRAGHGGKGGGGGGAPANSGHGVQHGYGDTNGLTNGQDGDTATANWNTHNGGNGGKHTGGGGGGGDHNQQSNPLLMRGGRGGSGIVVIQVPTTATTPSQSYDTVKTITVSDVPSTLTDVVGNIYKGSTAYPIHATTSSSNVIIKNTGTYLSVFTTATQAFFTNAIDVTTQPTTTSDDNTIEDEPLSSGLSVSATLVFHHDTFANSDDPHGDGSITTAAVNGHVYSDTPTGTYTWGTLTSVTVNDPTGADTGASRGNHTPGNTTYKWTPPGAITGARMLLVGGGGGGGMNMGGGGGAGGFLAIDSKDIPESEQTVVVGQGGLGAPKQNGTNVLGQTQGSDNNSYNVPAYNGGDSSIAGETAYGGGSGGYSHNNDDRQHGANGGSGGGASGYHGNNSPGGTGVPGQGNNGGNATSSNYYSSGGGGAGQAGTSANSEPKGGDGLPSDILGTEYWWSGGGGGGGYSINGGDGGKGGGGGGAIGSNPGGTGGLTDGQAGGGGGTNQQANTPGGHAGKHTGGGGGGGAHYQGNNYGGNGGSGIVIIKFVAQEVGYAGSTAVPDETTTITIGEEAPSETLDVSTTTIQEPTLNLDFTVATTKLARNVKRYNGLSNSSIGARFNRHESRKKRIEKRISIPSSFSAELTANNASSPTTLTVTVANSKFVINGDETPTLGFIRGETYTFDQSDASNSGHPLVLATSEDGTQYTTGWTASGTPGTNGSHAFIVPYDVPDTIYYKCSNHNNMGGEIHTTFGNAFSLGDFDIAANTHVSGEYTLAVNYDGTTSNLYVNGDLISQTTPSPAISVGVKDFILGKEFDGYVKNFKFWNYAKLFLVTFSKVVFHYGSFDTVYGDADVTEAANNGHIFDDTPSGTYNWGTLGTPSTANRQTTYTWTPSGTLNVDILLVGGGGGSGYSYSGGGGAGGLVFSQNESVSGQQSIVVGDGANGSTERPYTTTGFDTSAFGYTAKGGGQGGGDDQAGVSGGSGGGGSDANVSGGSSNQDSYSGKGFGNNGGRSGGNGQGGGGGGGAGGSGDNAPSGVGGIGKDYSSVFGTTYGVSGWFAGGGAPSGDSRSGYGGPYAGGTGGQGGGGNYNQNGQPHTGGGGGGNRDGGNGYKGGSGIVIVILS